MPGLIDINKVPRGYAEIERVYGKFDWQDIENAPGAAISIDPAWIRSHVATIIMKPLPRPLYLHRLCEARFRRGLEAGLGALEAVGSEYEIKSLVSFVPRHKYHKKDRPLSLHSWAIAWDINPKTNRYGTIERVPPKLANSPIGSSVWSTYYNVPQELVDAMKNAGWFWGGDLGGRLDPMHFQLARGA
jgi:hypothetical protein